MHKLVEVVLMSSAKVDEGLNGLIGICGDILALCKVEDTEHVVSKCGEVGDRIVDVGRFVDADEGFIKDGEEVAEELEGDRFFDHGEHHSFIALAGVHLEKLFEIGKELSASFHLIINLG